MRVFYVLLTDCKLEKESVIFSLQTTVEIGLNQIIRGKKILSMPGKILNESMNTNGLTWLELDLSFPVIEVNTRIIITHFCIIDSQFQT